MLRQRPLPCVTYFAFEVLSAPQVQALANAVVQDGVTIPLQKLASIGSIGSQSGNCYRDMMRLCSSRIPLLQLVKPYHFSVPCPSVSKAALTEVSVYAALPHELFATVFLLSEELFHFIFNTKGIAEFWRAESAHREIPQGDLTRVVPVRFWGDDTAHCKISGFEALTWMSTTVHRGNPFLHKMPFGVLDTKSADAATHERFYNVFAWSLEVLETGFFPETNHLGQTWIELGDAHRSALAGLPLAGGWTARAWETTADQKWHAEVFKLPWYYSKATICHMCPAENNDDEDSYRNFAGDAPIRQTCRRWTHDDYIACFQPGHVPRLARLPGFNLQLWLLLDWLHLVPLGCALKVGASALLTLAEEGRWGNPSGKWTTRMNIRLKRAYRDFLAWTGKHSLQHSQRPFTCAFLTCSDGVAYDGEMKAKAHNSIIVLRWLASFTRRDSQSDGHKHRAALLWALSSMHVLFSTADFWLTDAQILFVQRAHGVVQKSWSALRSEAIASGKARWRMHPKLHMLEHHIEHVVASRRNPSTWWCFGDESLIGKLKQAGIKGHKGNVSKYVLNSVLVRLGLALEGNLRTFV